MSSTRWRRRLVAATAIAVVTAAILTGEGDAVRTAQAASTRMTAPSCSNPSQIAGWSLARRAAQLVAVPVQETDVASVARSVAAGVGGIVLFGDAAPVDLGEQLRSLEARSPGGIAPLVMTDEEGGGVQRMANLVGALPWARQMAEDDTPAGIARRATLVARQMRASGVTVDLAPVLDLASGPGPDAAHTDGPRSFSDSAALATIDGLAFAQGLAAGGVLPVVKHFPGEGSATANSDDAPAKTPPYAELKRADLLPFEAAIKAKVPAVMVGNAVVPGLSSYPASLSPAVITHLLRGELGFRGLVLTDSLSALGVTELGWTLPEAAVQAVRSGADLVLFNSAAPVSEGQAVISALVGAVRDATLPVATLNAAVGAVLAAKGARLCP